MVVMPGAAVRCARRILRVMVCGKLLEAAVQAIAIAQRVLVQSRAGRCPEAADVRSRLLRAGRARLRAF